MELGGILMVIVRSDKKFSVKVFVPQQNKSLFLKNCREKHLSMGFVIEEYIKFALDNYTRPEINNIIFSYFPKQQRNTSTMFPIAFKIVDSYWQKLGSHGINNGVSVSKAASCIFNHGLTTADLYRIIDEKGFKSAYRKDLGFKK